MGNDNVRSGAEAVRLSPNARSADALRSRPSRLWLWFVAAFVVQGAMWAAWIALAAQHKVQSVPLVQIR